VDYAKSKYAIVDETPNPAASRHWKRSCYSVKVI